MDFDSKTEKTCHSEPIIQDETTEFIKWSLALVRDSGIGYLWGIQRFRVGDCAKPSHILSIMDTIRDEDENQLQGADVLLVSTQAQECGRASGVSLPGQHIHTIVHKEIWGNYFPRIAWYSREYLETLLENQYPTADDLCFIIIQSRRRPKQTDSSNRMVSVAGDILHTELHA
ncbi:hypothetical protein AYI69_g3795 [Smittium culicis]|uniref:Uncharacterized protein n=1 Tax=Smittium culicis TaxID=133412 RepID=A0A1R1YIT8_9FUNG|nr:hypothetical protein AYI69_g3795 [Smittium culicis]